MKNVCTLFLVFSTITVFGQAPTQKDILGLPNIDLVNDYHYNVSKKIPLKVISKNFGKVEDKFVQTSSVEYIFNNKSLKIKEYKYIDRNSTMTHSYTYKNNLLHKYTLIEKDKVLESSIYNYDSNKRIITKNSQYPNFKSNNNYSYPNDNQILKNITEDVSYKFILKNGLITEKRESQPKISKEYIVEYKYNNTNMLIEESSYETFMNIAQPSNSPTISYKYNDLGYLKSETSITDFDNIQFSHYEYLYDDYNNWIARFKISQKGFYDSKSRVTTQIDIRTIEYSDNTTTGFTTINDPKIQEYMNRLKFKSSSPPKEGAYWSKLNDKQFKFYNNGKNISGVLNYVAKRGSHFYANDSITNTFYQVKDFDSKPIEKEYYKAIIIANNNDVLWSLTNENNFYIVKNGQLINDSELVYAKNKIDIFMYLKTNLSNTPSYVFVNAENVEANIFQKAIPYSDYLKTHPNIIEEIPTGAVWKKATNGGFWFYFNGDLRTQVINYHFFSNHCVVYDTIVKKSFLLKNYKTATVNKFNNAIELTGNKFWFKTGPNQFNVIINAKQVSFKNAIYAQNNIDIILLNDDNEKLYLVKDYKNKDLFLLYPITNYSDYTEKPTADYLLNEKVKNCNADKKCLTNLYDEVYDAHSKTSTEDQLAQEMANYVVKVYNVHPHLAFTVLMTNKRSLNVIKPLMGKLPEKVRTSIRTGSQEMLNDYNKYINSKEIKDKVKENGGGYIKN